jgi:hypothetical protein
MSIDGIGRPPIPKGEIGSIGKADAPGGEAFRLDAPKGPAVEGQSELLARLERGELSVDGYVQARVDDAVRPFEGRLSAEQVQAIREALAQQLEADPVVVELVKRATLGAPKDEGSG